MCGPHLLQKITQDVRDYAASGAFEQEAEHGHGRAAVEFVRQGGNLHQGPRLSAEFNQDSAKRQAYLAVFLPSHLQT
jgi:hypothetical protein